MRQSWSTPLGLVTLGWLAALVALLLAVLSNEAPGRLLSTVAAALLGLAALFGTVARPRLAVDEIGVAVRDLVSTRRWPWSRVHRLRVVWHRRLGREVPTLELDAVDDDGSERLVIFGRLDLGAHPDEVLAAVQAVRGLS